MNKAIMKPLLTATIAAAVLAFSPAKAQEASSLNELLRQIQQGQASDTAESRRREAEFNARKSEQTNLLNAARGERTAAERRGEQLEGTFEANNAQLALKEAELNERLGELKELFGVLQQVAGDTQSKFGSSLTNLQFPDREDFLVELGAKMASSTNLASIEEIERLWFELQREINESGKVVRFTADAITNEGAVEATEIIRIGNFNVVADGRYMQFDPDVGDDGVLSGLPKQPQGRYTGSTASLFDAAPGDTVTVGIDPTRGAVLATLVESKSLVERVQQGGIVGYCIIVLGIVGLIIALFLMLSLVTANSKVTRQLKNVDNPSSDNPLGRVLTAYASNKSVDTETLELKLNEAVLKEVPKINRGLLIVKVISVVAPLAGLLGTVTGMIKTFQVITLYGAGDPKLMAGGISQALMTTVLGLVVAIPMVLLHTVLAGRAKRLLGILQEQSAGLIAEHSEAAHKG
ncbi:MAG: MotA/TolQ/ExbB proton channel family protein [Pseudomonadota bacterium]